MLLKCILAEQIPVIHSIRFFSAKWLILRFWSNGLAFWLGVLKRLRFFFLLFALKSHFVSCEACKGQNIYLWKMVSFYQKEKGEDGLVDAFNHLWACAFWLTSLQLPVSLMCVSWNHNNLLFVRMSLISEAGNYWNWNRKYVGYWNSCI